MTKERAAQKKIHGAAASAAERCDFCEKDSLLPVCRSWREHRPVYGPSLGICVVRELAWQGGAENSTFKFWPMPVGRPGYLPPLPACVGELIATFVPIRQCWGTLKFL